MPIFLIGKFTILNLYVFHKFTGKKSIYKERVGGVFVEQSSILTFPCGKMGRSEGICWCGLKSEQSPKLPERFGHV